MQKKYLSFKQNQSLTGIETPLSQLQGKRKNFFNRSLVAPQPTLGNYQGDNLCNQF